MGTVAVPAAGDIIWLTLDPGVGHEQIGRRPFLVLSRREYNAKTGLIVGCPVTSRSKGYPFEVPLSAGARIEGVVLADQVRNVDWRARATGLAGHASRDEMRSVVHRIVSLIDVESE